MAFSWNDSTGHGSDKAVQNALKTGPNFASIMFEPNACDPFSGQLNLTNRELEEFPASVPHFDPLHDHDLTL